MNLVKLSLIGTALMVSAQLHAPNVFAEETTGDTTAATTDAPMNKNKPGTMNENGNLQHNGASDAQVKKGKKGAKGTHNKTSDASMNHDVIGANETSSDESYSSDDEDVGTYTTGSMNNNNTGSTAGTTGTTGAAVSDSANLNSDHSVNGRTDDQYAMQEQQATETGFSPWLLLLVALAVIGAIYYGMRNSRHNTHNNRV